MKRQNRRFALALALVMLLIPALALATDLDIDSGSITIYESTYDQGSVATGASHDGTVNITSGSGNSTANTVTVVTSNSDTAIPQVNVTDVTFTGPVDPTDHSAAVTIEGDGEASVTFSGVSVTGDNRAIDVYKGDTAGGGLVNLDLTDVNAAIAGQGAAMSVNDSTVNITVHGENTVTATGGGVDSALTGIGLSVNNADVTVTGDTAGDALTITSASPSGTVSGDGESTLTVEGEATLTAVNTAGAEPIADSGLSVSGEVEKQTEEQIKITTVTALPGGGEGGGGSNSAGENETVKIPTVEELKAMTPAEVAALSPQVIAALTKAHIQVLTEEQIQALTKAQIKALTTVQISYLAKKQIQALTTEQVDAMSDKQKEALDARIAALNKAEDQQPSQNQVIGGQQVTQGQTIDGQQPMQGQVTGGQQPMQEQVAGGAVADAGQVAIAEKGVENFLKKLRESNVALPQNAAYPSGDTLMLNMNKIDNGIELGASADYKCLQRNNLASITLEKDGASVVLELQMLASKKPKALNLTKGNADDEPASEFGFVCPDDNWSLYIEGIDSAQKLVLPVSTNGPYEITINKKVVVLNVSLTNGKKMVQLPAVNGPGLFEIKTHGE